MADMSELELKTNEEMEGEYPGEQQPGEKRDLTVSAVITPHFAAAARDLITRAPAHPLLAHPRCRRTAACSRRS